ncbi:hypothetical protein PFICI_07817 [Pestalotiopsis fici W106-1]|uniref:ubiquitinyl hydrolase 1 n=1 Tax=Pestalotiopsis fici (strain W106-1 / CGMCC3.15140) TaxID=1229662 RepID=W3X2D4_PESFW|nr:uncharacterized protein PFICI_07817 [Pestalotiopsis fici W106-1]ETS80288.1 hypothetical protein PFICI_07817 [Pestalotiopsis fici W106-1]
MDHRYTSRHHEPPGRYASQSAQQPWLEWFKNPTVLIVAAGILFTAFYQSLHSSPFHRHRHPGELLWDLLITITPAALLYAIDNWLNPPMFPGLKSSRPRTFAAKSDLLRKLLGMDQPGGGIIGSVASAGKKSLSTLSGRSLLKGDPHTPAGLGNIDYSCFQNSILQGLVSLQPLPEYLESARVDPVEADQSLQQGSAGTLQQLIRELKDHENNGKTLWTPAKLKSLHSWEQQDAQEYFSKLLDEIEKEVVKAAKGQTKQSGLETALTKDDTESHHSDDSGYLSATTSSKSSSESKVARNPLEGMTAQRVACVQCGYSEGLSLQPFNCITLNLGVGTMQHDLYELLDHYTQIEFIEQVECNKCTLLKARDIQTTVLQQLTGKPEFVLQGVRSRLAAVEQALEEDDFEEKTLKEKCKILAQHRSSSTKTKQVAIARPPKSLAVHVNRSVFDFNTGHMWKNMAAVKFPRTLDLGPWCLGSADHTAAFRKESLVDVEKDELSRDQETWVSDPKASMISGDRHPSQISGPIYELRAVVTHQGQHENGHYICFRKHSTEEKVQSRSDSADEETESLDTEKTLVETTSNEEDTEKWWRLSDESVWEVAQEDVLGQGGVFMLFYDCVDPHSVLVSESGKAEPELEQAAEAQPKSTSSTATQAVDGTDPVSEPSIKVPVEEMETPQTMIKIGTPQSSDPIKIGEVDNFIVGLLSRPNS